MKTLMVLGGGINQLGLLKSAKECGYKVVLCDKNSLCLGREYSDIFYLVDIINPTEIIKIAKKEMINGIVSNSEVAMEVVAEVSSKLGLIGNTSDSIATLNSKCAFRDYQEKISIYAPKHRNIKKIEEIEEAIREFNFPIIIKPVKSSGTRGTTLFEKKDLESMKLAAKECMGYSRDKTCEIEEFVKMPSLTVLEGDVFINGGQIFWGGLFYTKRSIKLPMVPMTYMSPYVDSKEHMEIIKNTINKIFYNLDITHGQYNVEAYFDDKGNFFVIEINARQGGHGLPAYVKLATGVDMDRLLVTTAVGEAKYFNEVMMIDIDQKYATRHAVFGDEDGILSTIYINEEVKKYVVNIEYDKQIGEKVEKRINGSSVIGFVNLVFDSYEEQHRISERIEEYIFPIIVKE